MCQKAFGAFYAPLSKIQYKDFRLKHLPDNLPLLKAKDHPIHAKAHGGGGAH